MGFLRSEDMYLYKFVVSKDNAYHVIRNFGQMKCAHFLDMNKNEQPFKLPYTDMIKRCEESERKLVYLQKECTRYKVRLITPENFEQLDNSLSAISKNKRKAMNMLFEEVENDIKEKEQFVVTQNDRIKTMHEVLNELFEYQIVLQKADKLIHGKIGGGGNRLSDSLHSIQQLDDPNPSPFKISGRRIDSEESKDDIGGRNSRLENSFREVSIRYMAGTIDKEDMFRFKKLLFRACRGKILSYFEELEVPLRDYLGNKLSKVVYVLVFEEGTHMKEKLIKLCDSFQGKRYQLPDGGHGDTSIFRRKIDQIQQKVNDTKQMIKITKDQMHSYLEEINQAQGVGFSVYEVYRQFIKKEKSVYQVLNQLQKERNLFYGFLWSNLAKHQLLQQIYQIQQQLNSQHTVQLEEVHYSKIKPPTYIKTNEFTQPFQEIVNTYGVPLYKEINPALFAQVTFPFLFGVMFGDIGHGLVLFIVGFMLCIPYPFMNSSLRGAFQMRYLILLMGFFSTFCGLIYNDFMSIPLYIFETCYDQHGKRIDQECTYPVGVDPIWYSAKNELTFLNSLKMKLSVILGVLQMSLGVFMKALNAKQFKNPLDLWHEFLPQIILLFVLFGYMDILIVVKWLTDYTGKEHDAPSIITTMINMFLNGGTINGRALLGSAGANQAVSIIFLLLAIITVPWMLFVKPLKLRKQNLDYVKAHSQEIEMRDLNADRQANYEIFVEEEVNYQPLIYNFQLTRQKDNDHDHHKGESPDKFNQRTGQNLGSDQVILENKSNEDSVLELIGQNHHEDFVFSEVFIHQLIETIEFVLGTISNTASYLRLWALSLAHSQLAKVFFENTVKVALDYGSVIGLVIAYPVWVTATLFVLMSMDVMECFLHTLRLHWVEFQNKFYKGQGYRFQPFNYDDIFTTFGKE